MNMAMFIELVGYLGSALVVVSMLMSSVVKLRVINVIGSVISAIYAFIIGSFPLALMNVCLVSINIYNLRKLLMTTQQYDLINGKTENIFLTYFLQYYRDDIKIYFPEFKENNKNLDVFYMIYCNATPAGVLLGKNLGEGKVEIALEYTIPAYRDCSIGKYLYSKLPREGIYKLIYAGKSEKHEPYLKKMGYIHENGAYAKAL